MIMIIAIITIIFIYFLSYVIFDQQFKIAFRKSLLPKNSKSASPPFLTTLKIWEDTMLLP